MKELLLAFSLLCFSITVSAQNRIAIANNADPKLYFEYVGLTIFNNSDDSIPCNFNSADYTEEFITSVLSVKYDVEKIDLPVEIIKYPGPLEIKKWVKSLNGRFDKVILISSMNMTDEVHNTSAVMIGSGLYSRSGNEVYSTIYCRIYNTADGKMIRTSIPGFKEVNGYVYSEEHKKFNPLMCEFVVGELKQFLKESFKESIELQVFIQKRSFM